MILFPIFVLILVLILYRYFHQRNQFFHRMNIPGPTPTFLFGNLSSFFGKPISLKLREWTQIYGSTYGYFEGGVPVLVSSDLDILNDVFIKQFDCFHGRKLFPLQENPDTDNAGSIFLSRGLRWKRLRAIANPVFSNSNLNKIIPTCESSINTFLDILDQHCINTKPFNIHINLQQLTSNIIARVAFGDERDLQRGHIADPYIELCRQLFPAQQSFRKNIWNIFAMVLPELKSFARFCHRIENHLIGNNAWIELCTKVAAIVEQRRQLPDDTKMDFIRLFLDAEALDTIVDEDNSADTKLNMHSIRVKKRLSTGEIVGQLVLFLIAGYETTSNALAYIVYHLAINTHVQHKLAAEIDSVTDGCDQPLTYEMLGRMKYTDALIKETLRLYPLASPVQARLCMADTIVGSSHRVAIPAGLTVTADVWSVQHSSEIWGDNAEEFDPDRFEDVDKLRQQHSLALMPFGAGPRVCIGMRFSIIEQKIIIARLIQRYVIESCDATQIPLKLCGAATISPTSVDVILKRRQTTTG